MLGYQPQFLWIDLEMSGLDPMKNQILQFACMLTDSTTNYKTQGPNFVIHADEDHLKKMDQWNTTHHTKSGLYQQALNSNISLSDGQTIVLDFLISKGIVGRQLILAGNSVHMDRLFLFHHMPRLCQFLHYRILDVTSIKIAVNTMFPNLFYKKYNKHRAMDDILQSIGQYKYYLQYAFRKP